MKSGCCTPLTRGEKGTIQKIETFGKSEDHQDVDRMLRDRLCNIGCNIYNKRIGPYNAFWSLDTCPI